MLPKITEHRPSRVIFLISCIVLAASSIAIAQPIQKHQTISETTRGKSRVNNVDIGTEKSPLIVKISPQEKSNEDAEKDAYDRGEKRALDRDTTYYTGTTAYITLGMLFVAVLQALLFLWQLHMMKETLKDSKRASEAAVNGAIAGRESADIAKRSMVASERAYVHHAGITFISHPLTDTGRIFWRFRPHWRNSGNTPTRGLRVHIKYEILDKPMTNDYEFEIVSASPTRPVALPPGGTIGSGVEDFFGDELNAVKAGQKYLYIWGVALYRSVFEEAGEHITKFCVQAVNITGDPTKAWDKDQPLGIDFISYGNHNCSDEDCLL